MPTRGGRGSSPGCSARSSGLLRRRPVCTSLPGSSPNVGVIGYTLGGGLSWLGRKYGFACNRVRAIELITADGEQRTVDADNEPELFWALRGGGGSYAIVTALHVELLPIAEVYAGVVIYPAEVGETALGPTATGPPRPPTRSPRCPLPAPATATRRPRAAPRRRAPDDRRRLRR